MTSDVNPVNLGGSQPIKKPGIQAKSGPQQTSPPPDSKNIPAQATSFFDKVKEFFKPVIVMLGIICGVSMHDNRPYVELHEALNFFF